MTPIKEYGNNMVDCACALENMMLMANELKIPHVVVSTIYMVLQLAISLGGILLPVDPYVYFTIAAGVLCVIYVLFKMKYYHLHVEYLKSKGLYVDWRQKKKEIIDKYSE